MQSGEKTHQRILPQFAALESVPVDNPRSGTKRGSRGSKRRSGSGGDRQRTGYLLPASLHCVYSWWTCGVTRLCRASLLGPVKCSPRGGLLLSIVHRYDPVEGPESWDEVS